MRASATWAGLVLLGMALVWGLMGLLIGSSGWQWPMPAPSSASGVDPVWWSLVWDIRAPRTVGAFLVGCLLGLAGAVAQGLFRNPLAEPYLLGSSAGAALLMALALTVGSGWVVAATWWSQVGLTGVAFVGAVAGVWLTLVLARGAVHTMRLLLCGVVVGVVLGALTQLLMVWSAETWRTMQAFMLGNTALLGWSSCAAMAVVLALSLPVALMLSRVLDALALGEDTARTLGVPLGLARGALVAVLALSCAGAVAQAGLVAFVGLVAPHLVRPWCGARHRTLLWHASLMGGVLLLAADVLSRWLLAPQELPVGVLTAVMGGVYLLALIQRRGA